MTVHTASNRPRACRVVFWAVLSGCVALNASLDSRLAAAADGAAGTEVPPGAAASPSNPPAAGNTPAAPPGAATPNSPGRPGSAADRLSQPAPTQPAITPSPAEGAQAGRETLEARVKRLREQQQAAMLREAHRPTAWQLQNPSGLDNRFPADDVPANMAPNTYYGKQFRDWNQMSGPVYERQLPQNQTAVPPLTQTRVMVAPYSYWGPQNQRWHNMSPGSARPSPLGGWNMTPGR